MNRRIRLWSPRRETGGGFAVPAARTLLAGVLARRPATG